LLISTRGNLVADILQRAQAGKITAYDDSPRASVKASYNSGTGHTSVWAEWGDLNLAYSPSPAADSVMVPYTTTVSWSPGDYAKTHKLYLDPITDPLTTLVQTTTAGDPGAETYDPATEFALGVTYQWRVDEVNLSDVEHTGLVWKFTIEPYLVIDDFEYADTPTFLGVWTATCPPSGARMNSWREYKWAELDYVNDEDPYYSEISRHFATPRNFAENGVKALSIGLGGYADNDPERLYIELKDTNNVTQQVAYPTPGDLVRDGFLAKDPIMLTC